MMKKTLDLALATGRADELYEMHERLAKGMELELTTREGRAIEADDNITKFASTISNPVAVKTKGRKSKKKGGSMI
jgi:hypothetical protein